jgi:ParB family chromosome partitioning protein
MAEDGARRQEESRFGTGANMGEVNGAAAAAAPRGQGDSRRQAAEAVTGKASYTMLEQISAIERVAADRALPDTVRKIADDALDNIQTAAT